MLKKRDFQTADGIFGQCLDELGILAQFSGDDDLGGLGRERRRRGGRRSSRLEGREEEERSPV